MYDFSIFYFSPNPYKPEIKIKEAFPLEAPSLYSRSFSFKGSATDPIIVLLIQLMVWVTMFSSGIWSIYYKWVCTFVIMRIWWKYTCILDPFLCFSLYLSSIRMRCLHSTCIRMIIVWFEAPPAVQVSIFSSLWTAWGYPRVRINLPAGCGRTRGNINDSILYPVLSIFSTYKQTVLLNRNHWQKIRQNVVEWLVLLFLFGWDSWFAFWLCGVFACSRASNVPHSLMIISISKFAQVIIKSLS